jgi:hypothetical protein
VPESTTSAKILQRISGRYETPGPSRSTCDRRPWAVHCGRHPRAEGRGVATALNADGRIELLALDSAGHVFQRFETLTLVPPGTAIGITLSC